MLPQLLLALALGFKHSYDPDHLVAVSTVLSRTKGAGESLRLGARWAAGHMLTAGIITSILFLFREALLKHYFAVFEQVVAVMLVVLGLWALREVWKLHTHVHRHGGLHLHVHGHVGPKHPHRAMLGIGIVHGLASNDELLILLAALFVAPDFGLMLLGVVVFSIGVVLGMSLFSSMLGLLGAKGSERIRKLVVLASGLLSIGYGLALLLGFA